MRDEHPTLLCGTEVSILHILGKEKVLHRDPECLQEKLGFPADLGIILDLWIHKAVLEHVPSYLPLGNFLTSKLKFPFLNFQSGFQ